MALLPGVWTRMQSWWQGTPLPSERDAPCRFQTWHAFDAASRSWAPAEPPPRGLASASDGRGDFRIATWNIDAMSPAPQMRADAILSHVLALSPAVDVLFLQEVSRAALGFLLGDARIRRLWYSSDVDASNWGGHFFGTVTLASKQRFDAAAALGPVWRVAYPSRFGRDALCCDILVPSSGPDRAAVRVRLVNVHLDSLPMKPSRRPRQLSVIASLIRSAGRGLVAGDFNPVLPEDDSLVQDRGLTDAWHQLRGQDPGFTWGIDGKQPFPPGRLDKVATMGIHAEAIGIMHPETVANATASPPNDAAGSDANEAVPWSDHSGLWCHFRVSP